jgi:hypothetical protein
MVNGCLAISLAMLYYHIKERSGIQYIRNLVLCTVKEKSITSNIKEMKFIDIMHIYH